MLEIIALGKQLTTPSSRTGAVIVIAVSVTMVVLSFVYTPYFIDASIWVAVLTPLLFFFSWMFRMFKDGIKWLVAHPI